MSTETNIKNNNTPSMKKIQKISIFLGKFVAFAAIMILLDHAFSYSAGLSPAINYGKSLFAGAMVFLFAIYYFWSKKLNFVQIVSYLGTLLFLIGYIATRVANGVILPQVQAAFGFSEKTIGFWNATFSLAYGLFQVPIGYLINRFGLIVVGVLALLAGGSSIGISLVSSVALVFLFRGLMGFFCAGAGLGSDSVLIKLPVNYDEIYGYSSALAALVGTSLTSLVSQISKQTGSQTGLWRPIHRYLGVGMILGGLTTVGVGIFKYLRSSKVKTQTASKKSPSIIESLKDLCSLRHVCSLVWAMSAVVFMYITDTFNPIIAGAFPNSTPALASKVGGLTGAVLALTIPLFSQTFPGAIAASFPIISGLQLLGFIGFVFGHHIAPWVTCLFTVLFTLTGYYHVMLFLILAKRRKNKGDAPVFFGIYNFFVMFFGCALAQMFCGWFVNKVSGTLRFSAALGLAQTKVVKLLFPLPIIVFITSFFIIKIPKKVKK
jgi:MFS family permease